MLLEHDAGSECGDKHRMRARACSALATANSALATVGSALATAPRMREEAGLAVRDDIGDPRGGGGHNGQRRRLRLEACTTLAHGTDAQPTNVRYLDKRDARWGCREGCRHRVRVQFLSERWHSV
eukprot:431386-Pleurochrysis_carterae.AAC.4